MNLDGRRTEFRIDLLRFFGRKVAHSKGGGRHFRTSKTRQVVGFLWSNFATDTFPELVPSYFVYLPIRFRRASKLVN